MTFDEFVQEIKAHLDDTDASFNENGDIATFYAEYDRVEVLIDGECFKYATWTEMRREPIFDGKCFDEVFPLMKIFP